MTSFTIADTELDGIKDQAAIIAGASSGIGLATLRRVIKHGGRVFACDLNPLPEPEASSVPFMKVDVTSWDNQLALFKAVEQKYKKIDRVVANVGVGIGVALLEDDVDDNANLLPPKLDTFNVNLVGVMYSVKLGLHYLKKNLGGGSIIMTSSVASFTPVPSPDYTVASSQKLPIRMDVLAPSWTDIPIMSPELNAMIGDKVQSPDVIGRSAVLLMLDKERHGDMLFGQDGKFLDLEKWRERIPCIHAQDSSYCKSGDIAGGCTGAAGVWVDVNPSGLCWHPGVL
ncbi:hypothetical protein HRS9139_00046 [Pyrenophora teres f. teres]|nr:hypothetical protein HRS9139_00046 [Pyrenophora teres f. teres]